MADSATHIAAPPNAPYVYRVFLINGQWFDCRSVFSWPLFWNMAKADGHIITEKAATQFAAIVSVADITDGTMVTQPQGGTAIPPGTTVQ